MNPSPPRVASLLFGLMFCLTLLFFGNGRMAWAAEGDLDPTFDGDGKVTTQIGGTNDVAGGIAVQSDGKIVVAGVSINGGTEDFALARYNNNGSLDQSFGSGGKVTTPIGNGYDGVSAVVLQNDGKIVAAGVSYNGVDNDFALVRYNSNGSLDTSFGSAGKVTTSIGGSNDTINAVVLQNDGKIVAAGPSINGGTEDFALVRYNSDGSLDTSFGSGGKVTTPIGGSTDSVYAIAVQNDGKIVAAGVSNNGVNHDFALVRYNSSGSLDTTFGSGGKVTTPIGSGDDVVFDAALQSDGKIVAAGYSDNGIYGDFALVRYNSNGSLDTAFGSGGKVTTPIGSTIDVSYAVVLQSDGKIVAIGLSSNGSNDDFALVRYNSNGSLDTGFGSGGKVTTPIGSGNDAAYGVALQSDGKIVAAGYSYNGVNNDFAVARYQGTPQVLSISDAIVMEGRNGTQNLNFTVTLSPARTQTVSVNFSTSNGTELAGSDYQSTSGILSFAPGQTTQTISVPILGDTLFENDETFVVNLSGATNAIISDAQGIGTIGNANASALSLSFIPSTFSEGAGAGAATGTVSIDAASNTNLTISLTRDNPGAVNVPLNVVIPAGALSANFLIDAVNDGTIDGNQTSTITASAQGLASGSAIVTVIDDDGPSLGLSVDPSTFSENAGASAAIGTVSIAPSLLDTRVVLFSSDTSVATVPSSVIVPAGQSSATFAVTAINDALATGPRSATITANSGGLVQSVLVTVTDDEAPLLTLSPVPIAIDEGGTATVTVTRNTPTNSALVVNVATGDSRVADVVTPVTIPAGQASQTFVVRGVADGIVTGERRTLLFAATDAAGFNEAQATIIVRERDTPKLELQVVPSGNLQEGESAIAIIRRNFALSSALTVTLGSNNAALQLGTLLSGGASRRVVSIPAQSTSIAVPITVVDDNVVSGDRRVTLSAVASGATARAVTFNVMDNDRADVGLSLDIAPPGFGENAGSGAARGRVVLSRALPANLSVTLKSSDATEVLLQSGAARGASLVVTIGAGKTSASFDLNAVDDALLDGAKTVAIEASAKIGTTALPVARQNVQVSDNEVPGTQAGGTPTLSLSIHPVAVVEGGRVTATLSRNNEVGLNRALSVTLSPSITGQVTFSPATVTIAANATRATFAITTIQDTRVEGPQAVTITARAGTLATAATLTILDNDAIPTEKRFALRGRVTTSSRVAVPSVAIEVKRGTALVARVQTDAAGNYAVSGLLPGSYLVTAQDARFVFTPASAPVAVTTSDKTQNFVAAPRLVAISGFVRDGAGRPVAGAAISRAGSTVSVLSAADGRYTLSSVPVGTMQITARKTNFKFAPATLAVTALASLSNQNFTAFNNLAPSDIDFSPARGAIGSRVTITGRNLNVAGLKVLFGTRQAILKTTPTSTGVQVEVPSGATDGRITVETNAGKALSAADFDVTSAPQILKVAPAKAKAGEVVTIDGINLAGAQVFFGGAAAILESSSATRLRVRVPDDAPIGATTVTVRTREGTVGANFFVKYCYQTSNGARGSSVNQRTICNDDGARPAGDVANDSKAPTSPVRLSSATVLAANSSIHLQWTGALEGDLSRLGRVLHVVIGGRDVAIESVSMNARGNVVTLGLPEGAIRTGELVSVSWRGLHDASGRAVPNGGSTFVAR